jgi:hypothetical protein
MGGSTCAILETVTLPLAFIWATTAVLSIDQLKTTDQQWKIGSSQPQESWLNNRKRFCGTEGAHHEKRDVFLDTSIFPALTQPAEFNGASKSKIFLTASASA